MRNTKDKMKEYRFIFISSLFGIIATIFSIGGDFFGLNIFQKPLEVIEGFFDHKISLLERSFFTAPSVIGVGIVALLYVGLAVIIGYLVSKAEQKEVRVLPTLFLLVLIVVLFVLVLQSFYWF